MNNIKAISLLLAFTSLFCGCASSISQQDKETVANIVYGGKQPATRHEERSMLEPQLQTINTEDGINSKEANIIAQSYFLKFGPGCGMTLEATEDGEFWIAKTYVGYAGTETKEPIRIDKRTGRVTWSNGPTIDKPTAIFN